MLYFGPAWEGDARLFLTGRSLTGGNAIILRLNVDLLYYQKACQRFKKYWSEDYYSSRFAKKN